MTTSIHDLHWITRRTPKLLERHGITTLEQLREFYHGDPLTVRGIGFAILHDIAQAISHWEHGNR